MHGPTNTFYIDVHCHNRRLPGGLVIVSLDTLDVAEGAPSRDAGSSSNEQALQLIDCPDRYFSLGIHPWFIERQDSQLAFQTLETFAPSPNVLAIGECGLDKCIDTPMAVQTEVFVRQIELARRLGKPLIIHCVKAFNELVHIKNAHQSGSAWIIHGFTGKAELARQLLQQGCYLSFGKALLNSASQARNTLKTMPIDSLFLETDAASDVDIGAIYQEAAKILGLDIPTLQRRIVANFDRVFAHD